RTAGDPGRRGGLSAGLRDRPSLARRRRRRVQPFPRGGRLARLWRRRALPFLVRHRQREGRPLSYLLHSPPAHPVAGSGGSAVIGPHHVTYEQQGGEPGEAATQGCHGEAPPAGGVVTCTGVPLSSESLGLTMTGSVGWRPDITSMLFP